MATINPVPSSGVQGRYDVILWEGMATGDTINAQEITRLAADIVMQVSGTMGGATVTMTGSVDGTNFVLSKDSSDSDVSFTATGMKPIRDQALEFKPTITGGTGDDVDVSLLVRYAPNA